MNQGRAICSIVMLFILQSGYSQVPIIRIIDSQSGQLISFPSIQIQPLVPNGKKIMMQADSGLFNNAVRVTSSIRISCLGYVTCWDTIYPNESKTIILHPDPLNVKEVVVTGQFTPINADKSIYMINVINNQTIKDKAATNLTELLSDELDLRTFQDPTLGTNLTMQGLSGEQVKILVDGIPVIGRQDGILDLSQLSLSNVDHVEMIEGPMSVIYGTNALAGVVNIISKDQTVSKNSVLINSYYETVGIYNFDGSISLNRHNHHFLISGVRNFFGGYSANDTSRSQDWKPKRQYFGCVDYIYADARSKIHIGADYFNEKLLNLGGLSLISDSVLENNSYVFILRYNATDVSQYTARMNVKMDYTLKLDRQEQWQTVAAWSFYNQTINTVETNPVTLVQTTAPASDQDTTDFIDILCRSTFNYSGDKWFNGITGIDAVKETGTGAMLDGKKEIDEEAIFGTATLFPKEKLNFQAGVRLIHNSKYSAPVVYSINLKYQPNQGLITRLSFGKGFRSPSLQELYLDFVDSNHDIHGNDSLKAEYSYNFNLSAIYTIPVNRQSIKIEGSFFYNEFHNKIDYLYNFSNPSWAEYYNIPEDKYITDGAKLIVTYLPARGFDISGGLYFLGRSKIGIQGQYFYTTDYSCIIHYQNPVYHVRVSLFYKYFDNWYANGLSEQIDGPIINYVQANSLIKGYQSLNFSVNHPFLKNRLDVTLGCKNFFNVVNVSSYSVGGLDPHTSAGNGDTPIGWGRTFFVKLNFNFLK